MRKVAIIFLIILFQAFIVPVLPQKSSAGNLTNTFIRLDRQSTSTSAGGLICTTTPSSDNGIESSLQIIFPQGFTVNQSASNWTVNTSNLPAGSSPWPGISTATAISGQIVTFPSSNLSSSTQYCFNFSSSNTLKTPSVTGSFLGTIRTRTAGNTTIDTKEVSIGIASSDSINVTATVPAQPTDFDANLQLINPPNGTFAQNTELIYKFTYGSYLANSTGITLEIEWDKGTIQGNPTPTVDVVGYVIGSASNAYDGIQPVVDIANRRIYWSISPFPANKLNQSVKLHLYTKNSYSGPLPVTFKVKGRVLGPGTQTSDSIVTSTYLNASYITPTQAPTCSPSTCPTSTPIPTISEPVTTEISTPPKIEKIDIREISSTNTTIFASTNKPTFLRVSYGASQDNLTQSVSSGGYFNNHLLTIPNLQPNTRYYFRVTAIDSNGTSASSDIYIVNTATVSTTIPKPIKNSIVITSLDVQLTNAIPIEGTLPNIIIPTDSSFAFRFVTDAYENVKSINGILRNNSVLGAKTADASGDSIELSVAEISPGQYVGKFDGYPQSSDYKLFLRISDFNGNLSEQEIASIYIVNPLKIVNVLSKNGVENAKITLYYYNSRLKIYELLSPDITSIKNPNRSNFQGFIDTVLPEGKYRATVAAFGYDEKTLDFEVKPEIESYPTIELVPKPFDIFTYINYSLDNAKDALLLFTEYVDSFRSSSRFLELITLFVIILFTTLALFQISRVFGVPVFLIPLFIFYHMVALFHKPKHQHFIQGKVVDILTNIPIENVLLHFSTPRGKVFAHTRSNIDGDFAVSIKNPENIKISVSKKGYSTFSTNISKDDIKDKLTVTLSSSQKPETFGIGTISWYFKSLAESLFEAFLVITIIVEIIFAQQFGIEKVILPLIISIGNLLLWSLHSRPRKAAERRA